MGYGNRGGSGGFNRNRGGFRRNNFGFQRTLHKAVCAKCHTECEVPFEPKEGRPVYCRDCFMKQKGITPRRQETESETEESKEQDSEEEFEDQESNEGSDDESEEEESKQD